MQKKIRRVDEIGSVVAAEKKCGNRVVHCHGVFDLLHPGHIRHFIDARKQGDTLVVSLTPDRFVNKGPGRPAFSEQLRSEQLAALACVDFVVLNDAPDAISIIKKVQPDLYVKGIEYQNHGDDVTGKISKEVEAVESIGGSIYYTEDIVFSSSNLINRFFDQDANRIAPFMDPFKKHFSLDDVINAVDELNGLKVLVVGDAILDEYQYVSPLGQSGKGQQITASLQDKELFLGGSLVIANHLAGFAGSVDLLTAIGKDCPHRKKMEKELLSNVKPHFIETKLPTLLKKRYVQKDGKSISKLFETYSSTSSLLEVEQTHEVMDFLKDGEYDLVIACDFGNGFTNPEIISAICTMPNFLAVNTQTNSGNRGYNVITNYQRADYISLNEPELRLAAHDKDSRLEEVVKDIGSLLQCESMAVTRGSDGLLFKTAKESIEIPALTMRAIDRVGAGDSFLSLSAMSLAKGQSAWLAGFIGSVAAAIDVQIVGNREAINKVELCKFITRLMK
ncbi:MAG: Bifunctional protein HldE [Chlamydiales bacterium]|nr:Bifunctional protein HldE [Chlamydiales bacterium]MCH9635066.1 Bifunctional protein HldE [Chlamydiales bacterium]MCH9703641.1 adenylyltransferase/cytidyltransferase family protein [Chlamydiota bacterium]